MAVITGARSLTVMKSVVVGRAPIAFW